MAIIDFNKVELNRKIRIGLGLSLLVLMLASITSYYSIQKLIEQSKLVDHTNVVMIYLENIISVIKDAETEQRGYIITSDDEFLDMYNQSYEKAITYYNKVRTLTADNPVQQRYLDTLKPAIDKRFEIMKNTLLKYKTKQNTTYADIKEGKKVMDFCRYQIMRMQREEQRLLKTRSDEASLYTSYAPLIIAWSSFFAILVSGFSFYFISRDIQTKTATQLELSRLNSELEAYNDEINKSKIELDRQNYLLTGNTGLNDLLIGEKDLKKCGSKILKYLCDFMNAQAGTLYIADDEENYILSNTYALDKNSVLITKFEAGAGLLGQSVSNKKSVLLSKVPPESIKIESGFTAIEPFNILIVPFTHGEQVTAVIELASRSKFDTLDVEFIENVGNVISIFINSIKAEMKTNELLEETQRQAEELEVQQEELKQSNEELEEQTRNLKYQHEELQAINEELEQQTQSIALKNKQLEIAKLDIESKTKALEMSSKYKSDFLANMSHELRTPLNSLLILSKDLADNKKKNLDDIQVESAHIIYNSGKDLLQLINEVLDLSKIEAGKMELNIEKILLKDFANNITRNFKHLATAKNLAFIVEISSDSPDEVYTDRQRLDQIIRNLLSNAIKFTQHGSIKVTFKKNPNNSLSISVSDTGIGISQEKHTLVFEAFQQAEGGTSRKYGGTGLGLSISKELARLIGGYLSLESTVNEGSTFTLNIPLNISIPQNKPTAAIAQDQDTIALIQEADLIMEVIPDDRHLITDIDRTILIIDDDEKFAKILLDQAHERGFKSLIASTGEEGLMLAQKHIPRAIILDLVLPGINGKTVLAELKANPSLRHIPVHIISAAERTLDPIKGGAVEHIRKPILKEELEGAFVRIENFINRKMKNLLIVEDNDDSRKSIKMLIGNGDVVCLEASTGAQALQLLSEKIVDCLVLDLGLPDMSGFELIQKMRESFGDQPLPPIIIYTGKDLSKEENDELQNFADTIIIKGIKSEERLLDETALFLHRTISNLPSHKQQIINDLYKNEATFHHKKVLVVDDDMRNVFALSKMLKEAGLEIVKAENGIKALEVLEAHPDTDLVLMDIMMPEMDGYETMKRIRAQNRFKNLPILALTAKAMKDDRNKCIEAGANDYVSKPIEIDRLLSLIRIWIKK